VNVQQTKDLTVKLLTHFGLYAKGWTFILGHEKELLGQCSYQAKTIKISKHLIGQGTDYEITDTVLHEIAHALVGGGHGHNCVWRAKCREIGAQPKQYADSLSYEVPHKYEIQCQTHGTIAKRHRKLKKGMLQRTFCRDCGRISKGLLTQLTLGGVST